MGGELPHWGPEILYHPLRANCCVFFFILFCFVLVWFFFTARMGLLQGKLQGSFRPADKNLARVLFGPLALEDLRGT